MNDSSIIISVVLPTRNGGKYIASSIESCLKQTRSDIELIVVDGGSTDNTLEIVCSFNDPRIKVIKQPENTGKLPGALNIGFEHAVGEYWTWAQDDDYYSPEAFDVMVSYLEENPEIGMVYCGFYFIDADDQVIGESELHQPEDITWTNPVGNCFMYRRKVAEMAGRYDESWVMVEDFEFWIRMNNITNLALIPGRYYYHRLHNHSLTMANYGGYLALRLAAKTRREKLGIGIVDYQKSVSSAYIQEAFAAYSIGDNKYARKCVLRGIWRNPSWLKNRGVVSILLKSAKLF